jgi:hypothetical protein
MTRSPLPGTAGDRQVELPVRVAGHRLVPQHARVRDVRPVLDDSVVADDEISGGVDGLPSCRENLEHLDPAFAGVGDTGAVEHTGNEHGRGRAGGQRQVLVEHQPGRCLPNLDEVPESVRDPQFEQVDSVWVRVGVFVRVMCDDLIGVVDRRRGR